ncbi:MAG TPA: copper resistance protein CopC [Gaiellaceae bacterium]|nr:copper resistance protein CopC [Gaiellaceae bacterium]
MRRLLVVAVSAVALAAPASALAHATLVRTTPENGAVLAHAPRAVTVLFDDTVRVAGGNAAVANDTNASVLAGKPVAHGRTLTIPLKPLRDGAYSVRWAIVSDDGHTEKGVLAFAVGSGRASPHPVLGASVALTWNDILLRTLYYLGLLVAGGASVFGLATRPLVGGSLRKPLAQLLFFALLAAFIGASGITGVAPPGTRFDEVLKGAIVVALVGGAAAALAPQAPRLLAVAEAASLLLLAAPTLSGHALDRDQPFLLAPVVDLAHLAAAAVWLGGVAALVYALPRAVAAGDARAAAVRRFSSCALGAVAVLGLTGLGRALTELSAVSQVWSTSYGRALIVKTAIFVPLLAVGYVNRTRLLASFARLRRSATVELVAIAGIVVAVAILTELRPGAAAQAPAAAAALPLPPALPPRDAVVDARELGDVAVAIAREPGRTTVTLVGPDANGVDGDDVKVDGVPATPCGSGCYRGPAGTRVTVGKQTLDFDVPAHAADATARLARITAAYRASRTIVFDETLASNPTNATTTRFTVVAPHRLGYVTRGGPAAIVIGSRRWDRTGPNAPWVKTSQTPLDVTQPYWTAPTNVHEVAPGTFTFLDRSIPAWFRLTVVDGRPTVDHMTAAAHFMVDRYRGFDGPAAVSPPSR